MLPSLQSIFSTPSSALGRVEKATSRLLLSPDWMMNMDICNSINSDPWKAKAFVKAVRMRLQNKNSKVQFLALTLLEAMIKNCNDFVHFQVVERGILPEMVNIARKSKSMEVRDKILVLLESWQETFHGPDGRYPQFYNTYAELKRTGIHFPENPKNTDLILTLTGPIANQPQKSFKISTSSIGRIHQVRSETSHFSLSDLYNIQNVMYLFNNMLEAVNPNDQNDIKDEVITELVKQCEINQKKLVQLINSTEDDRLLVEALKLNDSLQTLLSKHDSLVSRSSPPELAPPLPLLSLPHSPSSSHQFNEEKEEEEEEDGFSALAKRNPVNGSMIDLLSLTVSPSPSPQTPPLPPPPSNQNQDPFSDSLGWEYYLNQNQNPPAYNNYVAPWARPAVAQSPVIAQYFPQQAQQYESNHLPPSWSATEGNPNPFLSTAYSQFSESQMFSSVSSKEVRVNVGAFQSSEITHF